MAAGKIRTGEREKPDERTAADAQRMSERQREGARDGEVEEGVNEDEDGRWR